MGIESISWASSPATRASMLGNRRRDTAPELRLRSELHRRGLRFRVDYPPFASRRRRADIVFTRVRLAVFVHGCFWHGCDTHCRMPRTNSDYWSAKIAGNAARDADTVEALLNAGWGVEIVWEHEEPTHAADRVEAAYHSLLRVTAEP